MLSTLINKAISDAGYASPDVIPLVRGGEIRGDFATSVAFGLAKTAGISSKDVADQVVVELKKNEDIASAESAGAGFINFSMTDSWIERRLNGKNGFKHILSGKKYIIEYSSPNIAKPMHVGHLRTTILGQVLVNLYRALGAEVVAWSHPGDWGVQFGKLIVAWQKWGSEASLEASPIDELLRVYIKFHQEAKLDSTLDSQAKETFRSLQNGDNQYRELWQRFSDLSLIEFNRMFELLGVKFDIWRGESAYNEELQPLVDLSLEKGIALISDGAVIIPLEGEKTPMLIRKSDGATLYATSDLVSIAQRVEEIHPDEIIYVVGHEQSLHLKQLFLAAEKLAEVGVYGKDFVLPKLTHVSYGFFRLATGKMSTRQGEMIRLDEVLNQAIIKADELLVSKKSNLSSGERGALAQKIGIAAVKYTDLVHDRNTDVVFDWAKMFALDGNSIIYLFYAFARCNSLLRQAGEQVLHQNQPAPWDELERTLAFELFDLESVLQKSITNYDPHHLLDHAYRVASQFSRLYNSLPILKSDEPLKSRRLTLTRAVKDRLQFVFDVLGVDAPERL